MNFLLLGGTGFLGGHIAAAAIDRGHQVTCLARGNGKVPNGAEFVSSDRDRDGAYDEVAGKTWDTIVDLTSQPKHARDAAAKLQAKHRIFVSSSSVYEDQGSISSESDSIVTPLEIDYMENMGQYPAAKSACETIYRSTNRSVMVVRPGLIAGYGDETGRSGYYPWRFAHPTGENVIVPDPAFPVAMIDVKDLAGWIVESAEVGTFGTFNATGFATSLSDVFKISRELTASESTERPCSDELLLANDVTPWMGPKSLPLWVPGEQFRNIALLDCTAAYEAGLRIRPLKETLADALRFEEEQHGERLAGLSDEEEVVLRQRLEDGI